MLQVMRSHLNKHFICFLRYEQPNLNNLIGFITKTSSLIIRPLRNRHLLSPQCNHQNHLIQWALSPRILTMRYLQCLLKRWKNESYLPNRSQKVILAFERTLHVVIRIWCFYKWFIGSFIKGKAMINSVYVRKQITITTVEVYPNQF